MFLLSLLLWPGQNSRHIITVVANIPMAASLVLLRLKSQAESVLNEKH